MRPTDLQCTALFRSCHGCLHVLRVGASSWPLYGQSSAGSRQRQMEQKLSGEGSTSLERHEAVLYPMCLEIRTAMTAL